MKGAHVHVVYLDPSPTGAKVGLDDHFAAGGTVTDLLVRTENALRPLPHEDADEDGPYVATPAGFVFRKDTRDGQVEQPLSNFTASITEEVIADDGASERFELAIEGELGEQPLPPIRVSTRRFQSLDWVNGEWGARPIIAAGFGNRDRLREAIQRHSSNIARRRIYEHSGWRNLPEHGWSYLHAGGAISASGTIGDVDVALNGAVGRILFPDPPSEVDLREAIRACLALLDLAPDHLTIPLFGAVFRALLCEVVPADTSVFLVGPTGVFKTELAALAMQHVGAGFDRLHLPAHWSATDNSLERSAFNFKDAPFVIDDFAPGGTATDVARLHAKADRILRGAGNRSSRGRMWADGSLRPDFPPRDIVIGTGEDAPRGQSLRSRTVILDVAPGDVDQKRLSAAQALARDGVFVAALAGCIQWIAPQMDDLREELPRRLANLRAAAHQDASHARTPDAVAHLAVGCQVFLRFAADVGALTPSEAQATFDRVWVALGQAAERQAGYQACEEPARHFLDLLDAALVAGHVHVACPDGRVPPVHPGAWGWREGRVGAAEYERTEWRPQGSRAGWVDGDDLYLDLDAALAGIQRVSQATGNGIAITSKTLAKRLHERGLLQSTDRERGHLKVRHTIEGRRRDVLHLAASTNTRQDVTQSPQSPRDDAQSAQPRGPNGQSGSIYWADSVKPNGGSAQVRGPVTALGEGNGAVGPIGSILEPQDHRTHDDMHHPPPVGPRDVSVCSEGPPARVVGVGSACGQPLGRGTRHITSEHCASGTSAGAPRIERMI